MDSMCMIPSSSSSSSSSTMILTSGASGRINALFSLRAMKSLLMLIHAFMLLLLLPFQGRPKKVVSVVAVEKVTDEKKPTTAVVRVPSSWWRKAVAVEQEVATRRALARRRVMQDSDDDKCVRKFSLFTTPRGETLFTQSWTPVGVNIRSMSMLVRCGGIVYSLNYIIFVDDEDWIHRLSISSTAHIRGLVIVLHGLNEHSGRYNDFAKKLNANGFKVYGMDWIGHGGSDGLHAYVHSLDAAVSDLKSFFEMILAENPQVPKFFFGHSTGAAIVLKAALDPKVASMIAGVVVTSPAVGVQTSHPIYAVVAPIVSFLLPRYQVGAAHKKGLPVSRDPAALVEKYSDPLVCTSALRVRTGYEILRIASHLQSNLTRIKVPFLVLHGTADSVTDPEASLKLYKEAASTDKTIRLLEGYLHDLLFEPEKEAITQDIIQWINSRST